MAGKFISNENMMSLSLGYKWSPKMTFETFQQVNKIPRGNKHDNAWQLFRKIEERYIYAKYN